MATSGSGFKTSNISAVNHQGLQELVTMNRHHLLRVLDQLERKGERCPRLEWFCIPLAMFLGVLGVLQTTDFRDAFGTSKVVWNAFWIGALVLTGAATASLFVWWCGDQVKHLIRPLKTTDQIVEQIVAQMEKEAVEVATQSVPETS